MIHHPLYYYRDLTVLIKAQRALSCLTPGDNSCFYLEERLDSDQSLGSGSFTLRRCTEIRRGLIRCRSRAEFLIRAPSASLTNHSLLLNAEQAAGFKLRGTTTDFYSASDFFLIRTDVHTFSQVEEEGVCDGDLCVLLLLSFIITGLGITGLVKVLLNMHKLVAKTN